VENKMVQPEQLENKQKLTEPIPLQIEVKTTDEEVVINLSESARIVKLHPQNARRLAEEIRQASYRVKR
jgi:hypothetical protein